MVRMWEQGPFNQKAVDSNPTSFSNLLPLSAGVFNLNAPSTDDKTAIRHIQIHSFILADEIVHRRDLRDICVHRDHRVPS